MAAECICTYPAGSCACRQLKLPVCSVSSGASQKAGGTETIPSLSQTTTAPGPDKPDTTAWRRDSCILTNGRHPFPGDPTCYVMMVGEERRSEPHTTHTTGQQQQGSSPPPLPHLSGLLCITLHTYPHTHPAAAATAAAAPPLLAASHQHPTFSHADDVLGRYLARCWLPSCSPSPSPSSSSSSTAPLP